MDFSRITQNQKGNQTTDNKAIAVSRCNAITEIIPILCSQDRRIFSLHVHIPLRSFTLWPDSLSCVPLHARAVKYPRGNPRFPAKELDDDAEQSREQHAIGHFSTHFSARLSAPRSTNFRISPESRHPIRRRMWRSRRITSAIRDTR